MLTKYKIVQVVNKQGERKFALRKYILGVPTPYYLDLLDTSLHWTVRNGSFNDCLSSKISVVEDILKRAKMPKYQIKPVDPNIVKTEELIDG